jgi:pimeloyl-ACP methyl ester carboxylesterase
MEEMRQAVGAVWPLPAVPSVVLYAGMMAPTNPVLVATWTQLQQEFVGRLPGCAVHVLADSGHLIPRDDPDAVAKAVIAVVDAVRTGSVQVAE